MSNYKIILNGILKENPVLVLLLGMCPSLAITTNVKNSIGMGIATTFVLICSSIVISMIKKFIPNSVRLPAYIVVIAGFVTIIGFLMEAYVNTLYNALGVYLDLIVVNCIILGRAEMFASKNSVGKSALDGLGFGIGFTLAIFIIGSVREILGAGTWYDIKLTADIIEPIKFFVAPAGGFFVLGCVIAVVNKLMNGKPKAEAGCANCPSAEHCHMGKEE